MKISIIVPVFNEKEFILKILEKVSQVDFPGLDKEIIIVDDGSTDGTRELLKQVQDKYKIIFHEKNLGKGAALRTGFQAATGEIIAIQDADLEYQPTELPKLTEPILTGKTQVVYGSRMIGNNPIGHRRYYLGNVVISWLASILFGKKLSDVETCYKVFNRKLLEKFDLEQNDFGFEVELTAKLLKNKISIIELPISYTPRKFMQGKKINWADGVKAIWLLFKYRLK